MKKYYQSKNWAKTSLLALVVAGASLSLPVQSVLAKEPLVGALQPGAPVTFADLIEQVSPAVVSVNVIIREETTAQDMEGIPDVFREWLERQRPNGGDRPAPRVREGRALGSGFVISDDGYIVTNHHVIAKASEITIQFEDGKEFDAELIGSDERTDLAVLKIESPKPLPHVSFATDIKLRVGDWVVAVGNPFGLGGTATAGIVSATGREIGRSAYDFIQVDASINQGNSGGPTFDLYGNVVGVNSQILSPSGGNIGIGFAIPARVASKISKELIEKGSVTRGW
ncbi:HtrA protease/chaperone protein, partial [hydrothermal vent metagenome]